MWNSYKFSEMAYLQKDTYLPSPSEKLPYIGLEHIDEQSLSLNSIGTSNDITSNKFLFESNDVLFGKLRPYFRKVYKPQFKGICSTDIWVLRTHKGFSQEFLFYFLANPVFIKKVTNASIGTHMPRADWSFLSNTRWLIPLFEEQEKIASILSSLDQKIDLLRRQNKTLEQIAQTLFKRWFVDFEFPDENGRPYKSSGGKMVPSEMGDIPEGWRVGTFNEIAINFDSKRIPLSKNERENKKGIFPYYGAASILDYINDYIFEGIYVLMAEDGTVIDDNGLPILQYVFGKFWVNNHTHVLQGKNHFSTNFIYLFLKKTKINSIITGAVQPKINQENMNSIKVVLPYDEKILNDFNTLTDNIFAKIRLNTLSIQSLTKTRDFLLPKLMSGKIRVIK